MRLDDLLPLLREIYAGDALPEPFDLLAEAHALRQANRVAEPPGPGPVDRRLANRAKKVAALLAAPDALEKAIGVASGAALAAKLITRAEKTLGVLMLGTLAEQAFEIIYKTTIGTSELRLQDERASRTDTDYRVLNGGGRQIFRMNIKLHGARFRNARDMVNLDPADCFPLATYKIWQGLNKQEKERLPYLWVVIDCDTPAVDVGKQIPRPHVDLLALVYAAKAIEGKKLIEERVVEHLLSSAQNPFAQIVTQLRAQIAAAPWHVISARRANAILREKLFERVFAVRVKNFARSYGGAELNMHFSLTEDMTTLQRVLAIIRDNGIHAIVAELERGTV